MTEFHIQARAELDRELAAIRKRMLLLGDRVAGAIEDALRALRNTDKELAETVIVGDAEINEMRFEIEKACESVIATQQPAASDLRAVVAAMNIVVDLERMGDHAAGIAKTVQLMDDDRFERIPEILERMAARTQDMLRQAVEVYARADYDRAYNVALMDDKIDDSYQSLTQELLQDMLEDEKSTTRGLYLLFAGHNLERIGDRATNIAERVIFMASGKMRELNPEPGDTRVS
ncbi:MAG: phosphate signaling complex protein PhoU [Anaerolineae bacterium]|nr:MAG: phosphate signaling complex protein PhoU [Anaerolineae bacterium]